MPERDFVTEPIKVAYSGVVAFDDLYKRIYSWFSELYGYDFIEKEHTSKRKGKGKQVVFKWEGQKLATDYVMFFFTVDVKIDNMVEVKKKGSTKKLYQGDFTFVFAGHMQKDYEQSWTKNALMKFMREVNDRYIAKSRMKKLENELLDDIHKLKNEVKAFLNLQKTA